MSAYLALLAAFAAASSTPLLAQSSPAIDGRAVDAVRFFTAFCVSQQAKSDFAEERLGQGNELANRLSAESLSAIRGRPSDSGWVITGPSGGLLLLAYETGMCEVRANVADADAMSSGFRGLAATAEKIIGKPVDMKPQSRSEVGGVGLTTRVFTFSQENGMTAQVTFTSADKPVGENQHILTYNIVAH